MNIIISILVGVLAGKIMKGGGFGFLFNLLIGVAGGFIGGNLLSWLGISFGESWFGTLITAVIGAVILLWIISLLFKRR